jgi:hypothetical protein
VPLAPAPAVIAPIMHCTHMASAYRRHRVRNRQLTVRASGLSAVSVTVVSTRTR